MSINCENMKLATIVINVNPEGCNTEVTINTCALYALDKTIHLDTEDVVNIVNENSTALNNLLSDVINNQFKKTIDEIVENPLSIMKLVDELKELIEKGK